MKTTKRAFGSEFKALELKLQENSINPHVIYFKEHSVREQNDEKPSGRTLFIVNIPPYADIQGLKNAFSKAGIITSVIFAEKPGPAEINVCKQFIPEIKKPGFQIAYVVFEKVSQLDKALKLTELSPMSNKDYQVKVGIEKWIEEYNKAIWHPKDLKETIESYMATFDKQVKETEEKEKELAKEDDDGWVTVTKKGKVKNFTRSDNVENKIMAKEENKKKRKELKNFYTFQIRESKMKNIVALRQKFEEDKQKIQQIKQTRRFKPF